MPALFAICQPGVAMAEASRGTAIKDSSSDDRLNLEAAKRFYEQGDYQAADRKLDILALREAHLGLEALKELYVYKSRVEFAFGRLEKMKLWLDRLHRLDASYELDPAFDSWAARAYFSELQQRRSGRDTPGESDHDPAHTESPDAEKPEDHEHSPGDDASLFEQLHAEQDKLREASQFWVGLLPLGIGHFDAGRYRWGAVYMGSEILALLVASRFGVESAEDTRATYADDASEDDSSFFVLMGLSGFVGLWGYEVLGLMDLQIERDHQKAEWLHLGLSFVPFGVGQLKNGEPEKAIGFAAVQSSFLLLSGLAPTGTLRSLSGALGTVSLLYGAYDGWAHHRSLQQLGRRASFLKRKGLSLEVRPLLVSRIPVLGGGWSEDVGNDSSRRNVWSAGLEWTLRF